jgi:hypothetical protein
MDPFPKESLSLSQPETEEERLPASVLGVLLEKLDFELTPTGASLAMSSVGAEPLEVLDIDASDLDVDVSFPDGSRLLAAEASCEPFVFDGSVDVGASDTPAPALPIAVPVEEAVGATLGRRGRPKKAVPWKKEAVPAAPVAATPVRAARSVDRIGEGTPAEQIAVAVDQASAVAETSPVLEGTADLQAPPVSEGMSASDAESSVETTPVSDEMSASESESSSETTPVSDEMSASESESSSEATPVSDEMSASESESSSEATSVIEAESTVKGMVSEATSVIESTSISEATTVIEAPSISEATPVIEAPSPSEATSVVGAPAVDAPAAVDDHPDAESDRAAAFRAFEGALVEVLLGAGLTRAAALLPAVLEGSASDGARAVGIDEEIQRSLAAARIIRETPEGARFSADFVTTARAWREVLSGETQDLSACGTSTLDGWAGDLLKALGVGRDGKVDVRRELRRRGVAAFGMLIAA